MRNNSTFNSGRSRTTPISKMEFFMIIINGLEPLEFVRKSTILDVVKFHNQRVKYLKKIWDLNKTTGIGASFNDFFSTKWLGVGCILFSCCCWKLFIIVIILPADQVWFFCAFAQWTNDQIGLALNKQYRNQIYNETL